jgi:hypothetical protein
MRVPFTHSLTHLDTCGIRAATSALHRRKCSRYDQERYSILLMVHLTSPLALPGNILRDPGHYGCLFHGRCQSVSCMNHRRRTLVPDSVPRSQPTEAGIWLHDTLPSHRCLFVCSDDSVRSIKMLTYAAKARLGSCTMHP